MYKNIGPGAPAPLTNIGNFSTQSGSTYWTSTEEGSQVWYQLFGKGSFKGQFAKSLKYISRRVRPIRSF
jgi:hypothetical protein